MTLALVHHRPALVSNPLQSTTQSLLLRAAQTLTKSRLSMALNECALSQIGSRVTHGPSCLSGKMWRTASGAGQYDDEVKGCQYDQTVSA